MSWQGSIRRAVVVGALLAAGAPAAASAQQCADADLQPNGGNDGAIAAATLCLVNVQRAEAGLSKLKPSKQLQRAAAGHSRDMVAKQYFAHDSPSGSTIFSRVKRTGYLRGTREFHVRENLGWGSGTLSTPATVVDAWMHSQVHRDNVLSRAVREGGVGLAKGSPSGGRGATFTMVFGSRRR
jgi:uncharacterized protein YkwD